MLPRLHRRGQQEDILLGLRMDQKVDIPYLAKETEHTFVRRFYIRCFRIVRHYRVEMAAYLWALKESAFVWHQWFPAAALISLAQNCRSHRESVLRSYCKNLALEFVACHTVDRADREYSLEFLLDSILQK